MLSQPPNHPAADTTRRPVGLTVEDRRYLLSWTESARANGIDATEDLRMRPWPVPITADVLGVFRVGETMASWLVVGQNGLWTVVSVEEGSILATHETLAEALTLIHRPRRGVEGMPRPADD